MSYFVLEEDTESMMALDVMGFATFLKQIGIAEEFISDAEEAHTSIGHISVTRFGCCQYGSIDCVLQTQHINTKRPACTIKYR